jgi:hypothetical protein
MILKLPWLVHPVDVPGLPHRATMTCGGVTGHASDCERLTCMDVVHENCTPTSVHPVRWTVR